MKPSLALAAALLVCPVRGACAQSRSGGSTSTITVADVLSFNAPTAVTQRTDVFLTEILGRVAGGPTVFDQFVASPFGSAGAQTLVAAAFQSLVSAGAAPASIVGPTLTSHAQTLLSSTTSTAFTLASSVVQPLVVTTTIGPATITAGYVRWCGPAVGALPSPTPPVCIVSPQQIDVLLGDTNIDSQLSTIYTIDETRTTTDTYQIAETYQLTGALAPVTSTPEPAAVTLLGTGLAALVGVRRRRSRTAEPA